MRVVTDTDKHLFILSGQSNMQRLKPALSFMPTMSEALGGASVLVVKEAWGGQPIRRWCKNWRSACGVVWSEREHRRNTGDLYDRLIASIEAAIEGQRIVSVTLVWMQGEEDAEPHLAPVYQHNLESLLQQFEQDIQRLIGVECLGVVIGQLNNYGVNIQALKPFWQQVQDAQVAVALQRANTILVPTRDLAVSDDGLHFSALGYRHLGQKFAQAAMDLLR